MFYKNRSIIGVFSACAALTLCAGLAYAAGKPLDGAAIKKLIVGKNVFLSVPLGGEFPLRYAGNGVVSGSGDGVGLGKVMQPKDSGRWWIAQNKLCQQWKTWYDGKPFCFSINQTGPTSIEWTRNDGMSGTARIAN